MGVSRTWKSLGRRQPSIAVSVAEDPSINRVRIYQNNVASDYCTFLSTVIFDE